MAGGEGVEGVETLVRRQVAHSLAVGDPDCQVTPFGQDLTEQEEQESNKEMQ